MIFDFIRYTAEPVLDNPDSVSPIVSGGLGSALTLVVIYIVKLIADRFVPTRSDSRASMQMVVDSLKQAIDTLAADKEADSGRYIKLQNRVDELEQEAARDYEVIRALREELGELRERLHKKDQSILSLVAELRKLGATVTGVDLETLTPEIKVVYGKDS